MSVAVRFDRVSKQFPPASVRQSLKSEVGRLLVPGRATRGGTVALREVSFTVEQGTAVALLGSNGSGKSTALRIATRLSRPTSGTVTTGSQRLGALIEIGGGLHPELSGRENVELLARILGFGREQARARLEEIVSFAGVEHAIDEPVKHYSSGMLLRLGFSIHALLDPEVLLVDEAISVGDAEFQERCLARMTQLVRSGCTLLFVSHDLHAVARLCNRAIVLERGRLVDDGNVREVTDRYFAAVRVRNPDEQALVRPEHERVRVRGTRLRVDGSPAEHAVHRRPLVLELELDADLTIPAGSAALGFADARGGGMLVTSVPEPFAAELPAGRSVLRCELGPLDLRAGFYELWMHLGPPSAGAEDVLLWTAVGTLNVVDEDPRRAAAIDELPHASVVPESRWRVLAPPSGSA